jgi:hypothetical protein
MNIGNIVSVYHFIAEHTNFSKETGFNLPDSHKPLGSGSCGVVFDIGNGKALKITEDPSEAQVAEQIKNKNLRGLYKTYGAFKFTNNPTDKQWTEMTKAGIFNIENYYFIVMEKLKENESRARKIYDSSNWVSRMGGLREVVDFSSTDGWADNKFKEFISDKSRLELIGNKGGKQLADDLVEIVYGLHNLNKLGIDFNDGHEGNMMFNSKDKAVLIDIGVSSGGTGKPKLFENRGPY